MDEALKRRLVAALEPIRRRVRTDTCWVKRPGEAPRRISAPLDDIRLSKHVNGGPVYGAVPIAPGTSVTWVAVLDFDSHKGETPWADMVGIARGVAEMAQIIGLDPIPFRSSGGHGIHMYFLWDDPQDARSVRECLRKVLAACRLADGAGGVSVNQVEIFPKQNRVEPDKFGSMFVLPGGAASVPLLGDVLDLGVQEDLLDLDLERRQSEPVPIAEPEPERAPRASPDAPGPGLERLAEALDALPNDDLDYDAWLKTVLSVHEATGGSEEGRELARSWSMKSAKHEDERFDAKVWDWASGNGSAERVVSGEYVFARARAAGWQDPYILEALASLAIEEREELEKRNAKAYGEQGGLEPPSTKVEPMGVPTMCEKLIFLEDGSRVSRRDTPHLVLPFADFKRKTQALFDWITNANGRGTKVYRLDAWLERPERLSVHTQTFAPGQPEFCWSPEGAPSQNLWLPRDRRPFSPPAPEDWAEQAKPFFDHIAYLVPRDVERERFLDWLAHTEQQPGVLPQTHYLLVARQTGIGRNWLSYVLARVWAGYVALGFDLADTLRSGFNGALSRKVLACVDELHEAGTGPEAARTGEKLKSMLTERTREINPKYGRRHIEFNCCRFLMFSNHDAALPLAENDRRVIVLENPAERQSEAYYGALYGLIDDPGFIGSVIKALQVRDIRGFRPGEVAPMNAAKKAVINAGRNDVVQAMVDIAAGWKTACITAADLKQEISEITGVPADKLGRLAGHAQTAGLRAYPVAVKVDGVATRVWILRDVATWSDALPSSVASEVIGGRKAPDADDGEVV